MSYLGWKTLNILNYAWILEGHKEELQSNRFISVQSWWKKVVSLCNTEFKGQKKKLKKNEDYSSNSQLTSIEEFKKAFTFSWKSSILKLYFALSLGSGVQFFYMPCSWLCLLASLTTCKLWKLQNFMHAAYYKLWSVHNVFLPYLILRLYLK